MGAKVRFCTLFSGSTANCTYIEIDGRGILIDAGASAKRTIAALKSIGSDINNIDAVFITHEHSDHIGGLPILAKYHHIPIIANEKTLSKVIEKDTKGDIDINLLRPMPTGAKAEKNNFSVKSFASMHDSIECVGYVVCYNDLKIGVLTDAGKVNEKMLAALAGCKALVLESNHDIDMLNNGKYPYPLRQRILSSKGHLSNIQCSEVLATLVENGTEHVFLAHLSKDNNSPEIAFKTVCSELKKKNIDTNVDIHIEVAPRDDVSGVYCYD